MPRGGRLGVVLEAGPPEGVQVCVTDTGSGIRPDMATRLFTPFASTKPTGTGLGLSLSRRIIEEHGGRITAVNRPEGGACFTITLPTTVALRNGAAARADTLSEPPVCGLNPEQTEPCQRC